MPYVRLCFLTTLSLLAFSGNSLLCRFALQHTAIDPASFAMIRLSSGALVLSGILFFQRQFKEMEGGWGAAFALFLYAFSFAYAYVDIPAGTGALLLFAAIQISMILYGLLIGEHLRPQQWLGLIVAVCGLIVLMLPGVDAPPLMSAMLMIVSGIAWGVYSLLGRRARNPVGATAGNFMRAVPIVLLAFCIAFQFQPVVIDTPGLAYALISGGVMSGMGYVLWYAALKMLKVTYAATVQLSVPLLTACAGALFMGEPVTVALLFSSVAIVAGIALVVFVRPVTEKK